MKKWSRFCKYVHKCIFICGKKCLLWYWTCDFELLWLVVDMERGFKWKCKNRIEKKAQNLMKKKTEYSPSREYIGYNNVRIICGTLSWPSCRFAYFIWFVETNCISPKTVWTHSHKTMLKCNVALHIYFLCAYIWCFWRFFFSLCRLTLQQRFQFGLCFTFWNHAKYSVPFFFGSTFILHYSAKHTTRFWINWT